MTDPRPGDRRPTSVPERAAARRRLAQMREAREAEHAPDFVRERLLVRVRELGMSEGHGRAPLRLVESRRVPDASERWPLPADVFSPLPEGFLEHRRLLAAAAHPLLARAAGAALMVAVVVLVIGDVQHPAPSPAVIKQAVIKPPVSQSAVSKSAVSQAPVSQSPVHSKMQSAPASGGGSSGAVTCDPPAEPSALMLNPSTAELAAGEPEWSMAPRTPAEVRVELSVATNEVAARPPSAVSAPSTEQRSSAVSAPSTEQTSSASRVPWLSPALQAMRELARPYGVGDPNYPLATSVIARGDVRPERSGNLMSNGDFSRGDVMWSVRSWQGFGDGSMAAYQTVQAGGALCTELEQGQQVLGGWPWDDRRLSPSSFALDRGKRYRLSLRAWSPGPKPVELVVKVGHQKAPYTPAVVAKVPVAAEPGLFDIDFVPRRHDGDAGFAFVATAAGGQASIEFCIDDVSVRAIDDISAKAPRTAKRPSASRNVP